MSSTEAVLLKCRETNLKVLNVLTEIAKGEDVTEFITTIQLVQININTILKNSTNCQLDFTILKGLQDSLQDYETLLVQLNGTGKLVRFLASSRLRRKIEQSNSVIHKQLEAFRKSIQSTAPDLFKSEKPATQGRNSSGSQGKSIPNEAPISTLNEDEHELLFMIEDQDGKNLWSSLFGLESFMVSWDTFIGGLKKILFDIKEDEEKVLHYILDNSNTGFINQHKFSEFLKGFGPLSHCVRNIRSILSSPWFFGFLSRNETDSLLRDQPVGTFLIRFSSSQPGSFALGFTVSDSKSAHILIKSAKPLGFEVHEAENNTARTFQNLYELVDYYSVILKKPLQSDLPFESWFEGDVSGNEATEALSGQQQGAFLVRFSAQVGAYAVSFVSVDGQVVHSLIEHDGVPGGGFRITNSSTSQVLVFSSLKEVVSYYGDALKYPLKSIGNPLCVETNSLVVAWKRERQNEMAKLIKTVESLFDVTIPLPSFVSHQKEALEQKEDPRAREIADRLFVVAQ